MIDSRYRGLTVKKNVGTGQVLLVPATQYLKETLRALPPCYPRTWDKLNLNLCSETLDILISIRSELVFCGLGSVSHPHWTLIRCLLLLNPKSGPGLGYEASASWVAQQAILWPSRVWRVTSTSILGLEWDSISRRVRHTLVYIIGEWQPSASHLFG